jgi:hypothetical protein
MEYWSNARRRGDPPRWKADVMVDRNVGRAKIHLSRFAILECLSACDRANPPRRMSRRSPVGPLIGPQNYPLNRHLTFGSVPPLLRHCSIASVSASAIDRLPIETPTTEPVPLRATAMAP